MNFEDLKRICSHTVLHKFMTYLVIPGNTDFFIDRYYGKFVLTSLVQSVCSQNRLKWKLTAMQGGKQVSGRHDEE